MEHTIDQTPVAESVSKKITYEFSNMFLVKELDPIKVKKEFTKPVAKEESKDDKDVQAIDYDEVETETKEVESDFRTGIVLKVPHDYQLRISDEKYPSMPISIGTKIIYKAVASKYFDLLKDTKLVTIYDVIGVDSNIDDK